MDGGASHSRPRALQKDLSLSLTSSNSFFPTGELQAVDGYMNIALENCTEIRNGKVGRNWGDAFIRGNNGTDPPPIPIFWYPTDNDSVLYWCNRQ